MIVLCALACHVLDAPIAMVSLLGEFDPHESPSDDSVRSTPGLASFQHHVVEAGTPLVAPDLRLEALTKDDVALAERNGVALVPVPLKAFKGKVIGSVSVLDTKPRDWTALSHCPPVRSTIGWPTRRDGTRCRSIPRAAAPMATSRTRPAHQGQTPAAQAG